MNGRDEPLRHIFLANTAQPQDFTPPSGRGSTRPRYPRRNIRQHGANLQKQLEHAASTALDAAELRRDAGLEQCSGMTLTFDLSLNPDLRIESLEDQRAGIQLLTVNVINQETATASVFVPDGQLRVFERKVRDYLNDDKITKADRRRNEVLVNSIEQIRRAVLADLWTDVEPLPGDPEQEFWWEVWIRESIPIEHFRETAHDIGIRLGNKYLHFPDRTVTLAYSNSVRMRDSVELLDSLAELRRARTLVLEFLGMDSREEREIVESLEDRLQAPEQDAPAVCILDTGVDYGHPLLSAAHAPEDAQAYNDAWGRLDHQGHGTEMAGFALYGVGLEQYLLSQDPVDLRHGLENVKILPPTGANEPDLYGEITESAVAKAEIQNPGRRRVFSVAVTEAYAESGVPSSWSAAVDQSAAGAGRDGEPKRLFTVSSGNVYWRDPLYSYPESNMETPVQSPAQAWNALTIGSCTSLTEIFEEDLKDASSVAPEGDLSPSNSTSQSWPPSAVIKPDLVFEGGNLAIHPDGTIDPTDSLLVLTTRRRDELRFLTRSGETSGAASAVAHMGALILVEYPDLWPETVRALLVHSARWTPAMIARFGDKKREEVRQRLRCYGHGIPNEEAALYSLRRRLTIVVEDSIQPFRESSSGNVARSNEMHLHSLPWPDEALLALEEARVQLRVTLSYFIEPKPGKRGFKGRYQYPSFGLRFDVKTASETTDEFVRRVNKEAREEGEETTSSDTADWTLGPGLRSLGSVHSDVWSGTAAELASKDAVAVFPVTGWWKLNRQHWNRRARYSLVVSIETDDLTADVYTPVLNQIGVPT